MSSGSELEFSESSNSMSVQSAMDSAYFSSSPGTQQQAQVPATHGSGNTAIADVMHTDEQSTFLRITEQPQEYFRKRYKSETTHSTHGCLLGRTNRKTYPTVEVDKALIRCRLFQSNIEEEHVHELVIGQPGKTDVSQEVPENGSYKVCFRGIGIIHKSKKKVEELLLNRYGNIKRAERKKMAAAIDPNVFRLRFSAHDVETDEEICPPVYSEVIKDSKNPSSNELVICKYSRYSGRSRGGDDIFLLVNKVSSDNIKIRFFELNDCGERIWTTELSLMKDDVHNQFAIVFRTPPYKDVNITSEKKVFMELFRPSDHSTSKPKEYVYKANAFQQNKKRKLNSSFSAPGPSTSSVPDNTAQSVSAVPVTTIEVITEDYRAQIPQKYEILNSQRNAIPTPQYTGSQFPQNNATLMLQSGQETPQSPQTGMQIQQSYGMQSQQNSGIQMQGGIEYTQNIGVQYFQNSGIQPHQVSMEQAQNIENQLPQSGLKMIQEGQLPQNCRLPYSPASVEENFNDSAWDIIMTLPLDNPFASENDVVTTAAVNNYSSVQLDDLSYPTPQPSPGNSNETASGAQSNNSDTYRNSIMNNNPVMSSAAVAEPDPAREQSVNFNLIDPADLDSFLSADWDEYLATFDMQDGENNFNLQRDSGRAKSDSTKKSGQPCSKNLQQRRSSDETKIKTNNDKNKEYSAYYKLEDGIEVKKLIKEICKIVKMDGYKKKDVRCLLERLFAIRLSNGDTFLHMTLISNIASFEYIVKLINFLNMPHLLNLTNDLHHTILHIAVFNDIPRLVELLVAKGCDPMLSDQDGNNLIHHAVMCQTSLEPLLEAARKNNVAVDLNARNLEKQTALHLAAIYDSESSARLLLQHGASYNASDLQGRTPLHLAVYDDSLNVTRALLDFIVSSDIDAVDGRGYTALQIVTGREIKQNSLEILKLLLMKKADPMLHLDDSESAYKLAKREQLMWQIMKQYTEAETDEDSAPAESYEYESADESDSTDITVKFVEMNLDDKETQEGI